LYHFFWHEVCDWYIELAKVDISGDDPERKQDSQKVALFVLETSLRLMHPFIPFITEDLYQRLPHESETLMLSKYPDENQMKVDREAIAAMEDLQELISAMRTVRAENGVDPRKPVRIQLKSSKDALPFLECHQHHLRNLVKLKSIEFVTELSSQELHVDGSARLAEFSLLLDDVVDVEAERRRLAKEIDRCLKEISNAEKRLGDDRFLERAPAEVVEGVKRKRVENGQRLSQLEQSLAKLPGESGEK
jgi:valyl-tRNA synthetase